MLLDEQIEETKNILVPELSPYFIILFGSTAANKESKSRHTIFRKKSPID